MTMNLFFVEIGSPYSYDLARRLSDKGFRISHVTSSSLPRSPDGVLDDLGAKLIHVPDLYHSERLFKNYGSCFALLNKEILDFFQAIERDFYILTDRANFTPVTFRRRKTLFYDLVRFWVGYMRRENVECVYFPCTPHAPWELVLMQACRYLGVPCCYLSHTAINNRSLLRTEYADLKAVPNDYLSDWSEEQIEKDIDPELLRDFKEESVVTNVVKLENDTFNNQLGTNAETTSYQSYLKPSKRALATQIAYSAKEAAYSLIKGFSSDRIFRFPLAMDNISHSLKWTVAVKKHKMKAERLKAFYAEKAEKLDYSQPYIYFPLHLQPELTSQPEAGIFEDQLLALEVLLAALPDGWKIYLKENPRQFDPTINTAAGVHFRNHFDIERFAADENVCLVPQSEKSEKLIANAQITVTLSGTAGWESLNLGKPCMVFSYPWYSPCPSCFVVQNPDDVREALVSAQKKSPEVVRLDLLRYLHFYQNELKVATLHAPSDVSYNTRPYEELLDSQAHALQRFFS